MPNYIIIKLFGNPADPAAMTQAELQDPVEAGARANRHPRRQLTSVQLMLATALSVGLILALNFSSRINLDRALGRIHGEFSGEIQDLLAEQARLKAELAYVKSDAYVEFWARAEGKMVRADEILILPRGLEREAPPPKSELRLVEFQTTAPEPENWELWWALFFDDPPPRLK